MENLFSVQINAGFLIADDMEKFLQALELFIM